MNLTCVRCGVPFASLIDLDVHSFQRHGTKPGTAHQRVEPVSGIVEPDWTVFDGTSPYRITCHCGEVFYAHNKGVIVPMYGRVLLSRQPCPKCLSRTSMKKSEMGPEEWKL